LRKRQGGPMLKILSQSEVEELRETPGVVFPEIDVTTVLLSEADAIREGLLPKPPGAASTDYQQEDVHGPAGAVLAMVLNRAVAEDSQTVTVCLGRKIWREAVDALEALGRIKVVSRAVTT